MGGRVYNRRQRLSVIIFLVCIFGWYLTTAQHVKAKNTAYTQVFNHWLQRQTKIKTWSADVLQIRRLKALTKPLEARGHVWFKEPNRFRWQLGDPPRTIAVRTKDALLIVYPRLKRVEEYSLTGKSNPNRRYVMALLDVGFPTDPKIFYETYKLVSAEKRNDTWRFNLHPKSKEARKLLNSVQLDISAQDWNLKATEMSFADGSVMRNEFSNMHLNPKLAPKLFNFEIPQDYSVVNPIP